MNLLKFSLWNDLRIDNSRHGAVHVLWNFSRIKIAIQHQVIDQMKGHIFLNVLMPMVF